MFHALRSVVLSASSRLASSLTNVVRGRRWYNKARRSSLRRTGYNVPYIYMKNELQNQKNNSNCKCSSVHSKCVKMKCIKWNLMHDNFTCVFSIPMKFEVCFLLLPYDNLFFEVISHKFITFIALEKCQKESDTRA